MAKRPIVIAVCGAALAAAVAYCLLRSKDASAPAAATPFGPGKNFGQSAPVAEPSPPALPPASLPSEAVHSIDSADAREPIAPPNRGEGAATAPVNSEPIRRAAENAPLAGGEPLGEADKEQTPVFATTADGIREAMAYIKYDIKECYEEWLKLGKPIGGRIKLRFEIVDDGSGASGTRDVRIDDSTLQHTALDGCVGNAVAGLQFEATQEAVSVTYPFVFSSDKSGADAR